MGRALPEPPQPGARHVRRVAGPQPPRLQLPARRAERGARRGAGCPFGRAPRHARGAGRHGLWGARRGPGTRAQRGYHGAARRRVGEGTMGHGTSLLLRHRAAITTLFNLTLATAAWVLAFALRFDLSVPERYVPVVLALLPVLLGCKLAGFAAFRLSKGWWRHVSIRDLEDIVRGNVLASTLFLASVV